MYCSTVYAIELYNVYSSVAMYYTVWYLLHYIILYYAILYYTLIFCTVLSYTILYSVFFSDGVTTSFTCANHLKSGKIGYPHPLRPFERTWPPPTVITGCGYSHLLLCLENVWPPPPRTVLQCMMLYYTLFSCVIVYSTLVYYTPIYIYIWYTIQYYTILLCIVLS